MSARILHIETSGKNCSVALSDDTELLCLCEEMTEQFSHSKKLHTFIQWALEGAKMDLNDLNAVSISQGPGSYTGLRIGTSAAKGLAFGLQIPMIATQTLHTLALPYFNKKYDNVISTLDAKRMELFYQLFNNTNNKSNAKNAELNDDFLQPFFGQKNLIIGSGSQKIQDYLQNHHAEQLENFHFNFEEKISAQNAIPEAYAKFQNSDFEDVAYFEPNYVKSVHITQKK